MKGDSIDSLKFMTKIRKLLEDRKNQIILLVLITILTYINIFQNGFAYDDKDFLIDWPLIKNSRHIPELILGELPPLHQGVYRPVRSLVYLISYKLWGTNPFGYHLQSLIIHASCVILVFLIVQQISKNRFLPFGSALIFSLHPIHTEAVSYITASFDTLGIGLFLLAFLLYIKAKTYNKPSAIYLYLVSLFLITISFLIYEVTITFLLVIILFDLCFGYLTRKNLFEKLKIYYLFALPVGAYLITRFLILNIGNRADYLGKIASVGAHQARIEFPFILAKYLSLIFIPYSLTITHVVPGNLLDTFVNSLNSLDTSGKSLQLLAKIDFLLPILEIVFLCIISAWVFAKEKILKFTILWFFITLLPVSSVLPQGAIIAERFLYLPSVGFFTFLVYLFYLIYQQINIRMIRVLSILVFLLISSAYGYLTYLRNLDWKDSSSIWLSAIKVSPQNPIGYGGLGKSYFLKNQFDLAINAYQKSLELDPFNERALTNLAISYEHIGKTNQAEEEYKKVLKINSKNPDAHSSLGKIYMDKEELDLAESEYKKAIEIYPYRAEYFYNLGVIYDKKGKIDEAFKQYNKALLLNPKHSQSLNNIAIIYSQNNNLKLAVSLLKQAKESDPKNSDPYFNLGQIYEIQGEFDLAIKEYQNGLRLKPDQLQIKSKLDRLLREGNY